MEQQEQRNGWNPEEDPRYRDIRGSVGGQGMYNPEEMQRQRLASSAMVLGIAAIGSCLLLPVFFPLVFASVATVPMFTLFGHLWKCPPQSAGPYAI